MFYSDGITESLLPDGSMFGIQRLHDLILENHTMMPEVMAKTIRDTLFAVTNKNTFEDDATCIVIRIGEKTELHNV